MNQTQIGHGDWWFASDSASGNIYFYNRVTRETRWTLPTEELVSTSHQLSASLSHSTKKEEETRSLVLKSQSEDFSLIREAIDPLSKRLYFYNPKTKQSFWEDPRRLAKPSLDRDSSSPLPRETLGLCPQTQCLTTHAQPLPQTDKEEYKQTKLELPTRMLNFQDPPVPTRKAEFNQDHLRLIKKKMMALQMNSKEIPSARPSLPSATLLHVPLSFPSREPEVVAAPPRKVKENNNLATTTVARANTSCTRKSGCLCNACSSNTTAAEDPVEEATIPCKKCGRKFVQRALAVHERICAKVFQNKPTTSTSPPKKETNAKTTAKTSKWRKQSEELRMAMQRGRGDIVEQPLVSEETKQKNDDLVACPHCERRFNEKAAERHIPRCNDIRSKPKMLRKGEGKIATALTPVRPVTAPATTPGFKQPTMKGKQLPLRHHQSSSSSDWDDVN